MCFLNFIVLFSVEDVGLIRIILKWYRFSWAHSYFLCKSIKISHCVFCVHLNSAQCSMCIGIYLYCKRRVETKRSCMHSILHWSIFLTSRLFLLFGMLHPFPASYKSNDHSGFFPFISPFLFIHFILSFLLPKFFG